jgi:ureidoglycolate hydrolase
MQKLEVTPLTDDSVAPYGEIMQWPKDEVKDASKSQFTTIFGTRSEGWYVGYLALRTHEVTAIHRHPETAEMFVPLKGKPAIVLAVPDKPEELMLLALEGPVCLRPNVWHAGLSLEGEAEVLIVENYAEPIKSEQHQLAEPAGQG